MHKRIEVAKIPRKSVGPIGVSMQRRARVLHVEARLAIVYLYTEVEHDDLTEAVKVPHQRNFQLIRNGNAVPENGSFVGADCDILVYEVRV